DRLKRASLYDALTGALNRRAYEDGVGLEGHVRHGTALMLDMDNLKLVNDREGHAAGDELLCRLVETLRGCITPEDRLYRWGGDEFLVLLPAASPQAVVPRIRAAVEAANAPYAPDSPLYLQVSLGAAAFDDPARLGAAIEQADHAMYEDKALNRIQISRVALPAG
ncbi:MAG TPA: GGDEF domain-containing protein, partial [Longimicrobiaceae bacterium]|nr:GGDEF domain-containing protein [Longimicrobiaceae bacterium]